MADNLNVGERIAPGTMVDVYSLVDSGGFWKKTKKTTGEVVAFIPRDTDLPLPPDIKGGGVIKASSVDRYLVRIKKPRSYRYLTPRAVTLEDNNDHLYGRG